MDSPTAPAAPDPVATAKAQGDANLLAGQQTASLNRPDQYTPYGSQTWAKIGGRTFDQSGYDAAMKSYQTGTSATPGASATPGDFGAPANIIDYNSRGGAGEDARIGPFLSGIPPSAATSGIPGLTAPNRESFYSGNDSDARWASTVSLDPRVRAIMDAQLETSQGLNTSIKGGLSRLTDTLQNPIDYNGLPAAPTFNPFRRSQTYDKIPTAPTAASAVPNAPGYEKQAYAGKVFDTAQTYANLTPNLEKAQATAGNAFDLANNQVQRLSKLYGTDFNYDSLGPAPQANGRVRQLVEDAYYNRERSRLDPKFNLEEGRMRTDLMNRGVTEGSQAWGAQNENFGRNRNDAYALASDNAIVKGGEEMQRLFGMEMSKRQQGVGELNKMRELPTVEASAAMALAGSANSSVTSLANTESGQNAGKARDIALGSQLGIDSQNQEMRIHEQQTRLQAQAYEQEMRSQGQAFAQESQTHEQRMRAQAQSYSQIMGQSDQDMRAEDQRMTWEDRQRSTALGEQERKRALVLNELASLRSGSQVPMPQFSSGASGATVGAAPVSQAVYNSYQGQMGQYNADVGSNNSTIGALGGMAGAGLSGWLGSAAGAAALAAF